MAPKKKVTGLIKLQIKAGAANPAPPIGPALGQHGVNIMAFTKEFNERTKNDMGLIIPVVITVYADRSYSFITKTPPASVLIKKACGIESGSGVPNRTNVATITGEQVRKIAEQKMPDLNAASVESGKAMSALTEYFDIDETEWTEEQFGPAVYGASLVNFPRTLKTKALSPKYAPRYNPVSSHSIR